MEAKIENYTTYYQDDFVVLIVSNNRAGNVKTLKALQQGNFVGEYKIVIDNLDPMLGDYVSCYGEDNVIVFDKKKYAEQTDTMDNFGELGAVVFARNACYDIAEKLGKRYFMVLDDDYERFEYMMGDEGFHVLVKDVNRLFDSYLRYLRNAGLKAIAMAQAGDFIGGRESGIMQSPRIIRKAMNTWFCDCQNRIEFCGTINEDVNAYVTEGIRGELYFTLPMTSVVQTQTQQSAGGLTTAYLNLGTYVKSFYSCMAAPSAVSISLMGSKDQRLHHHVSWDNTAPKILHKRHQK